MTEIKIIMTNKAKFIIFLRELTIKHADELKIDNLKEIYEDETTTIIMKIKNYNGLENFLNKFLKIFKEFYKSDESKRISIDIYRNEEEINFYPLYDNQKSV